MDHLDLILTLTSGLAAALLLGYVTHRMGLSPIVGYLLAGVVVGPNTPGFVANRELAEQLAEIGVILLMFGVGLHFHFKELLAVRRVAIPGAIGQSLVATLLGCLLAVAVGWGWSAGVVFGLAISVASTVVLLRVLADNNDLHTPTGHIAVGWLVVEDLFTVLVLVLLPVLFQPGAADPAGIGIALAWSVVKIVALIAFVFYVGGRAIPWLLNRVAATRSRELFTLTVLVMALGIAVGAAKLFGVSMALGAFLAGMVVGRSDFSSRAASEALPMRDAFAVLFFVSVGMLFDPAFLLTSPILVALRWPSFWWASRWQRSRSCLCWAIRCERRSPSRWPSRRSANSRSSSPRSGGSSACCPPRPTTPWWRPASSRSASTRCSIDSSIFSKPARARSWRDLHAVRALWPSRKRARPPTPNPPRR